jgi:hypothetical protein
LSQARYCSLVDAHASSSDLGFCLDGIRLGDNILPLDPANKSLNILNAMLDRATISQEMARMIVSDIQHIYDTMAASQLFMRHHLYGSSVLIICDSTREPPVMVKVIDLEGLVERDAPVAHRMPESGDLDPLDEVTMARAGMQRTTRTTCYCVTHSHTHTPHTSPVRIITGMP